MSEFTKEDREMLEAQASQLGVDFHPNISSEKLAARISEVLEGQEPAEKVRIEKGETKEERRQRKHKEATALVRCLIICNDPSKREWPGEWLGISNGAGVQIRKLVPYNQPDKPFHLPRILVNMLREKQVQVFTSRPGKYGTVIRTPKSIAAYTITELPPLTQQELNELAKSQMQRGALDD